MWKFPQAKPLPGTLIDPAHPLSRGLVGAWPCNEQSGQLVMDASLYGTHGLMINFPANGAWTGGPLGSSIKFDGVDSYIQMPYNSILNCPNGITMAGWVNRNGSINSSLIGKPFTTTHTNPFFDWQISLNGAGQINMRIGGTSNNNGTALPTLNEMFVATTADGVNWRWYLNGRLDATVASTALPTNTNSRGVLIGANASVGEVPSSWMENWRVYNRPLSSNEIWQLYQEPYAGMEMYEIFLSPPQPPGSFVSMNRATRQTYLRM